MESKTKMWIATWIATIIIGTISIYSIMAQPNYEIKTVTAVESIQDNTDLDMTYPTNNKKHGGGFNPYSIGYAKFNGQLYADYCNNETSVSEYDVENEILIRTEVDCKRKCKTQKNYVEKEQIPLTMGACEQTSGTTLMPMFTMIQVS